MGLPGDSTYSFAVNPSRASLDKVTTIPIGKDSDCLLAIRSRSVPRRAVCFTVGIVLQSDIVEPTSAFRTKLVKQILLSPFDQEWLRMGHFLGNAFGIPKLKIPLFKAKGVKVDGLVFKTLPKDDPLKVIVDPERMSLAISNSRM